MVAKSDTSTGLHTPGNLRSSITIIVSTFLPCIYFEMFIFCQLLQQLISPKNKKTFDNMTIYKTFPSQTLLWTLAVLGGQ